MYRHRRAVYRSVANLFVLSGCFYDTSVDRTNSVHILFTNDLPQCVLPVNGLGDTVQQ